MLYYHLNNYLGLTIEIQVYGVATTTTQFCIGEILTLVCRNDTTVYIWQVPPVITGTKFQVTPANPTASVNNINATYVSHTESTLVFVASKSLNVSVIRCINGAVADAPCISSTTLLLHGEILIVNISQG